MCEKKNADRSEHDMKSEYLLQRRHPTGQEDNKAISTLLMNIGYGNENNV